MEVKTIVTGPSRSLSTSGNLEEIKVMLFPEKLENQDDVGSAKEYYVITHKDWNPRLCLAELKQSIERNPVILVDDICVDGKSYLMINDVYFTVTV